VRTIELADAATGRTVCRSCSVADRPWSRLRGLLGRDRLEVDEGMLFSHTGSVHTYGMRFPIDVVFLAKDLTVLSAHAHVGRSRTVKHRGAAWTLELPAGSCHRRGITVGKHLVRRAVPAAADLEQASGGDLRSERRSPSSVGARLRTEAGGARVRRSSGL